MLHFGEGLRIRAVVFRQAEERELSAQQRRVAGRAHLVRREIQQTDAPGARVIDIIAEGPSQEDLRQLILGHAPLLQQDAQAGRDCAFGQLQFPHVPLIECHRGFERQRGAVRQPAHR